MRIWNLIIDIIAMVMFIVNFYTKDIYGMILRWAIIMCRKD